MLERVIENWLAKASEKSFQVPFCYMLSREGYAVVHISRHCGMELGKDILAIAPDGTPCAYQLKGGNISLNKWKSEISQQVQDLVLGRIVHPSIDGSKPYRAYLVTNGKIEEEVSHAIDGMNRAWQARKQPHLHMIVGGELLSKAKELKSDLWPTELIDIKTLLELFLESGREVFPKAKFANLLESTLPFEVDKNGREPGQPKCSRAISSAAILTAIALSSFSLQDNHAAEIDAWTLYISYILALAERWALPLKIYKSEMDIALMHIKNSMANLIHEVKDRKHLFEGTPFVDEPFRRIRMTLLLSLMSIYALWRYKDQESGEEIDEFLRKFSKEHFKSPLLWGEAAIPQILAYYWYYRKIDATVKPISIIKGLIEAICSHNKPGSPYAIPSPYYEAPDLLPYIIDNQIGSFLPHTCRLADEPLDVSFHGESATLEGIMHIFVRQNWKQTMKLLWPDVTRIAFGSFEFKEPWHFFRWRNEKGINRSRQPKHTQDWSQLRNIANESEGADIPSRIKDNPILLMLFLCVFPHRTSASALRWLDTEIGNIRN